MSVIRGGHAATLLAGCLAALIFALDLTLPPTAAVAVGYLLPVMVVSRVAGRSATFRMAIACTGLIALDLLVHLAGHPTQILFLNGCLAAVGVWATALLCAWGRESERRFQRLVEISPEAIAVQRDGTWVYANPAAVRLFGATDAAQLVGRAVIERVHPEDRALVGTQIREAGDGLTPSLPREIRLVRLDDRVIDVEAAEAQTTHAGAPAVQIVLRDVTQQKRIEAALRESEDRYRSLFTGMTEGFALHEIVCDKAGAPCDYRFLEVNPAFEHLTGLRREDVVGKLLSEVLPNDDPRWVRVYGEVALTGKSVRFENYSPVLNRHYEVFAYSPAPRQFAALFMDLTARKRIEEALRVSLTKYRVLFEAFPLGVTIADKDGVIEESNREAERLLGIPREGRTPGRIDDQGWRIVRPDGTPMPAEEYASVRALRENRPVDNVEMGVVRDDGEVSWINVVAAPIPLEGYGVAITYGDISRHRRAEEALRSAQTALERELEDRMAELTGVSQRLQVEVTRSEEVGSEVKRLGDLLKRRADELGTLDRVVRVLISSLNPELALQLLAEETRRLLGAERAAVLLREPDAEALTFRAAAGPGADALVGTGLPPTSRLGEWVLRERRVALVQDATTDALAGDLPPALADGTLRSLLAVPLVSKGMAIGILGAINKVAGPFTSSEVKVLAALANSAAVAIENSRLYAAEQSRRKQLEAVRAVAAEIARELDLAVVLQLIAGHAGELVGATTGTIWLWERESQMLVVGASLGRESRGDGGRLRLGEGVAGTVALRGEGMIVNEFRSSPYAHAPSPAQSRAAAVLAEPLIFRDRLVGVISLDKEQPGGFFRAEDRELLSLFAAQAATAIANARFYQELRDHRDRLRDLTAETLEGREEEAKRIARELHDEVGQALTSVLLGLQAIEALGSLEEVRARIAEVRALVAKPLGDVQRLVRALRPDILDDLGLVAALEWFVKGYEATTGLRVEYYGGDLKGLRLGSALETALYRIAQEALTNVAKHAMAKSVSVLLTRRDGAVVLIIEDDGQGFDVAAVTARKRDRRGLGLLGMEERAFLLGGTITIESRRGVGTTIVAEMPLGAPRETDGEI